QDLANAEVPLRLRRGPELLHHKCALIDGTICIHGSANWTRSAFKRNDEVLFISTPLTEEQRLRLEDIWGRCWSAGRER
ncbi:MAG: hypothetical protein KDK78_00175, partial [Chlamydiia bacterium]|nr:hypothetical protein [Chlamydiia bacterium]